MLQRTILRNLWMSVKVQSYALPGRGVPMRTQSNRKHDNGNANGSLKKIIFGVTAAVASALGYAILNRILQETVESDSTNVVDFESIDHDNPVNETKFSLKEEQNFALKEALRDAIEIAERTNYEATCDLKTAAGKLDDYATKLMCALGESICSDDHHLSKAVNDAKASQSSALQLAHFRRAEADKALRRLRDVVRRGRHNPVTMNNKYLDEAERVLITLQLKLDYASDIAAKSLEKAQLTQNFGLAIEDGKKQLIKEVNAILPEGKSFSEPKKLTTEDLALLISDTHKKIEALHHQLSRIQLSESEKAERVRQYNYQFKEDYTPDKKK
ncbi:MICOS complex subunit Mic60-like [Varroa jacobsoni]|uniref:Uncharacterized protein n=1 Tax=Varroa destructor TaxID=109461 RepID=A0A7M7L7M7_VARDE|nr:MICOS complex subunit Mic60-like [Varroa destructor]XP_022700003.1 MICOS complex subunit Mic60-like [Varroa jacobsoni]